MAAVMLLPWDEPTPYPVISGKASFYSQRTMEEVAHNRGMELDGAIDFVALNRAGDLARLVWLERNGVIYGPYRVCDVAQEGAHYEIREQKNLVVEVSFEQAMKWNMRGPIPIRVYFVEPIPDPPKAI